MDSAYVLTGLSFKGQAGKKAVIKTGSYVNIACHCQDMKDLKRAI